MKRHVCNAAKGKNPCRPAHWWLVGHSMTKDCLVDRDVLHANLAVRLRLYTGRRCVCLVQEKRSKERGYIFPAPPVRNRGYVRSAASFN